MAGRERSRPLMMVRRARSRLKRPAADVGIPRDKAEAQGPALMRIDRNAGMGETACLRTYLACAS